MNQSLESLLVSGGDDRMRVHPRTGLNKYGTAPRIRDAVPFGSCTASSPIEVGLRGARRYLERDPLFRAADWLTSMNRAWELTRAARAAWRPDVSPADLAPVTGVARRTYTLVERPLEMSHG